MFNVRTFILLFLATTKVAGFGSVHTEDERASRGIFDSFSSGLPSLDDVHNPKICNQALPKPEDLLTAIGWMAETIAAQMGTKACARETIWQTSCPDGYLQPNLP